VSEPKNTGDFSCVINDKYDFSEAFQFSTAPLKRIEVSFMALANDSVDMTFVASKGKWWEGTNLKGKVVPNGKWQKVSFDLELPQKQSANDTLALYFWNNKSLKRSLYIDDILYHPILQ